MLSTAYVSVKKGKETVFERESFIDDEEIIIDYPAQRS
jgi:hypothetical protein